MKKSNISYDNILDIDKLYYEYNKIRKNTRHKSKLINFNTKLNSNLCNILNVLEDKKYTHGKYNIFLIREKKYRLIMSEAITDKIVNHLVSDYILSNILDNKLINTNIATRKNKGTLYGINYLKKYIYTLKENADTIYVLKMDIKKYFYNIDHKVLINLLKKIYTDKNIINLLSDIIGSTNHNYVNITIDKIINNEIKKAKKMNISNGEKEKLIYELNTIPRIKQNVSLPIGNLTSQILAIFYLNDLDHFLKEKLNCKYYIRYMDDMIVLSDSNIFLKNVIIETKKFLKKYNVELNNKTQIYNLSDGINFLGYKFILTNKRLIIKINNNTKVRMLRNLKKYDKYKLYRSVASYNGMLKIGNNKSWKYKINSMVVNMFYKNI